MAGLLGPDDAAELVGRLKRELSIPVGVHTHFTSGMAYMTLLRAIDAGADIIDTCLAPFALRTSHAAIEPIVAALAGRPRDTGLDVTALMKIGEHFEAIAPKYREFLDDTKLSIIDTGVLSHQIPGGMFSNMVAQLRQADALSRLPEVYEELPRARRELGFPPLVTPTSQIVGTQAVLNVLFGRYKMISNEVKDYVYGLYGKPPAAVDPEVQKLALAGYPRGTEPFTGRAADLLTPELAKAEDDTRGLARDIGDVLCYALYPTTGLRFLKWKYGLEAPPPETKARTTEDVSREDERVAKARKGQPVESGPAAPGKAASSVPRLFTVKVGGEVFQVEVEPGTPGSITVDARTPDAASAPLPDSIVTAPMPGLVLRYLAAVGDAVKAGDPVVLMEAMKMQNNLPAPRDGRIARLLFKPGDSVNRGDVLLTLE
jgi:pyruvate carboxylase subunit B